MYIPLEKKPNTYSHVNCMEHVLRCWKRQSDDLENTRKPFRGRGSGPDPTEGAYSARTNP